MKKFCCRAFLLLFVCLQLAQVSWCQAVEDSGIRDREAAVKFCHELQTAVRASDKQRVAEWIIGYPIEVRHGNENTLVADDADFVQKFDLIFDNDMKKSLSADNACELPPYLNGPAKVVEAKIEIDQVGEDSKTAIVRISPPPDVDSIFEENEEYENGAAKFFKQLQKAVSENDRQAISNMCRYPLSVNVGGKHREVRNRAELIAQYSAILTPEVKRAVFALSAPIHTGWRGFMTGRGELWLDLVVGTHAFRVGTINGGFLPAKKHSEKRN